MTFDEVQLPPNLTEGARGGPSFDTTVLAMQSGKEQRNQNWEIELPKYSVGYAVEDEQAIETLQAFFNARQGMQNGFRFKDWSDYTAQGTDKTKSYGIVVYVSG